MAKANTTKKEDYSNLESDVLVDKIEDEVMRLKKIKFSHAVNPIDNPLQIKTLRREIARMKTEQRKRALGI